MGSLAVSFALGFLLGSIPAAWVVVRLHTRKDLATSGSSNVGALNALRVSRSKWVGVLVLVLDALKGAAAIWGATWCASQWGVDALPLQGAAAVGAMAGHNYNPWLSLAAGRLVGGKGFAAGAGALLVFLPWIVAVWLGLGLLAWLVCRAWRGITDEAPATAFASLAIIPAAHWIYGTTPAFVMVGFALLVMPKLVPEVRRLFSTPAGAA